MNKYNISEYTECLIKGGDVQLYYPKNLCFRCFIKKIS